MSSSSRLRLIFIAGCLFFSVSFGFAFCIKIQHPVNNDTVSGVVNINAVSYPNNCLKNKSYSEIDEILSNAPTSLDKEVLKAFAWYESGWLQFAENGNTFEGLNFSKATKKLLSIDYGLMQVNDKTLSDKDVQTDTDHNIAAGISILNEKIQWVNTTKNNVDQKKWKIWTAKYDLQGHSMQDIYLKAYNTFQKSWEYADAVNKNLKEKPWLSKVQVVLNIDDKARDSKQVPLNAQYQYQWNTSPENEGRHPLKVQAIKGKAKSQDSIIVNKGKENVKSFDISGIGVVNGCTLADETLSTGQKPFSLASYTIEFSEITDTDGFKLDSNGKIVWGNRTGFSIKGLALAVFVYPPLVKSSVKCKFNLTINKNQSLTNSSIGEKSDPNADAVGSLSLENIGNDCLTYSDGKGGVINYYFGRTSDNLMMTGETSNIYTEGNLIKLSKLKDKFNQYYNGSLLIKPK